jgi:hypothetical protein
MSKSLAPSRRQLTYQTREAVARGKTVANEERCQWTAASNSSAHTFPLIRRQSISVIISEMRLRATAEVHLPTTMTLISGSCGRREFDHFREFGVRAKRNP